MAALITKNENQTVHTIHLHMRTRSLIHLHVVITLFAISSCAKHEGCMDPIALNYDPEAEVEGTCNYGETTYPMEMHIHQYLNGSSLTEEQMYTINGVHTNINLVQFYVSGITLVNAEGESFSSDTYLLVKPETEAYAIGDFPPGEYTKVIFNIGVDSLTNHADPSQYALGDPLGAQSPTMHWGWSFGYIFIRIDGEVDTNADGVPDPAGYFEMHAGEDRYLARVEVDMPVTVGEGAENIVHMAADWDVFFSGVDMVNDNTVHGADNITLANALYDNTLMMFSPED